MGNFVLIDDPNKKRDLTGQLISHFDLNGDPFSIENTCFFEDAQRKHNIETLRHLAIFGDMVLLLTGEIGAGKTSLIEHFVRTQADELNIYVHKNPAQFIRNGAGVERSDRIGSVNSFAELAGLAKIDGEGVDQTLSRLIKQCDQQFQESGKRTLLILDDADLLSKEELTLYFSLFRSLPVESGVVVLLAGTPKLLRFASADDSIGRDEQLHQIQLKPLTNSESIEYIQCRLASVGFLDQLSLSEGQRDNLAKIGKGLPGRINRFFACIIFELGLPETEKPSVNYVARKVLFSIVGLLLLSFVLVSYQHGLLDLSVVNSSVVVEQDIEGASRGGQPEVEESSLIKLQRDARLKMLDLAIKESSPKEEVPDTYDVANDATLSSDGDRATRVNDKPKAILSVSSELVSKKIQSEANKELEADSGKIEKVVSNVSLEKQVSKINVSAERAVLDVVKPGVAYSADDKAASKQKVSNKPKSFRSKGWVVSQSSSNYSAQLLGSYNEDTAIKFIEQAGKVDPDLFYLKTLYKGRDWYVVFYGSFASKKVAQNAISAAPKVVQKQGPWLRRFEGILNSYPK